MIRAFEVDDLKDMGIKVDEQKFDLNDGILVDEEFLSNEKLSVGDEIEVDLNLVPTKLKIVGTFKSENQFASTSLTDCFFSSYETISILSSETVQKYILIDVKDESETLEVLTSLEKLHGINNVFLTFDEAEFTSKYSIL